MDTDCRSNLQDMQANPLLAQLEPVISRIEVMREQVRRLCYAVSLFQRKCTRCGARRLVMLRDSWCRCQACGREFDPTIAFQSCSTCDAALRLKVNRYWCPRCRVPVQSRFCFGGHVFNAAYFREKMAESRKRQREKVEEMKKMLANSRSEPFVPQDEPSLDAVPGIEQALDKFVKQHVEAEMPEDSDSPVFDLELYRNHIRELADGCVVNFEGISRLTSDPQLDRIFRFIAVVFMENAGEISLEQDHDGHITVLGT